MASSPGTLLPLPSSCHPTAIQLPGLRALPHCQPLPLPLWKVLRSGSRRTTTRWCRRARRS